MYGYYDVRVVLIDASAMGATMYMCMGRYDVHVHETPSWCHPSIVPIPGGGGRSGWLTFAASESETCAPRGRRGMPPPPPPLPRSKGGAGTTPLVMKAAGVLSAECGSGGCSAHRGLIDSYKGRKGQG